MKNSQDSLAPGDEEGSGPPSEAIPDSTAASFISALVSLDGESNWLEGAMLLVVYGI